jgi:hypothetical protein
MPTILIHVTLVIKAIFSTRVSAIRVVLFHPSTLMLLKAVRIAIVLVTNAQAQPQTVSLVLPHARLAI